MNIKMQNLDKHYDIFKENEKYSPLGLKFKKFVDKYYPLPLPENIPPKENLKNFKRKIWYCNFTGSLIPELQEYNSSPIGIKGKENESIAGKLYQQGYTYYRVYPCGHSFIDIMLLSMVYDYLRTVGENFDHELYIKNLEYKCLLCQNNRNDSKSLYYLFTSMNMGTIILRPTIPKKYLPALTDEFEKGEVVDTGGYRGLGLYIFNGEKFVKTETYEYYPIWSLEYLKLRGYRYYLTESPETWYDELKFENEISHYMGYGFAKSNTDLDDKYEKLVKLDINSFEKEKKYYLVPYPFSSPNLPNSYLKSDLPLRAKLSEEEYLYFNKGELYIADKNEDNKVDLIQ